MAKSKTPAPTADFISTLRSEAERDLNRRREKWDKIVLVRSGQHAINVPSPFDKVAIPIRTRAVGDAIRRVVSSLTIAMPTVAVPPSGPGYRQQENSSLRERWSTALLADMDAAHPPDRPFRQAVDHAVSFGEGVWKLVYVPHTWFDYPTSKSLFGKKVLDLSKTELRKLEQSREVYKRGRVPFAWRSVDPRTFWSFETDGRLVRCLEVTERLVADVLGKYPQFDLASLPPQDVSSPHVLHTAPPSTNRTLKFTEYWDEEWVTYMVENVVLEQWQHGYGRVPYFRFYGLSDASKPPGHQGESVVEHALEKEIAVDALLTMKHVWARMACYPMGYVVGPEGSPPLEGAGPEGTGEEQTPPDIEFKSGWFKVLPPGWKPEWMQPPPVSTDINQMITFLADDLKTIIPNVLKGIGLSDQPGYAINQLITAARLVYDPISDNASVALQEMVKFIWWLVENKIKESVYILGEDPVSTGPGKKRDNKWLGLGPHDIHGYYACSVNISPLLPSNRIAEGQFGLQAWQTGGIPWRMYLEDFLHVPNPDEVIMERKVEDEVYKENGTLYQWAIQRALRINELDDILREKAESAALAGVSLPPGIQERMQPIVAGPGVPAPENLAPGQVLTPQEYNIPPVPGAPPEGGMAPGFHGGGRAAGVGIQPSTVGQPGGLAGEY